MAWADARAVGRGPCAGVGDTRMMRFTVALAMTALAAAGPAQVVQDQSVPDAPLDIPTNLQIFGKLDPNVRKPTAIVNDTVITGTDVDQRLALIALYNNVTVDKISGEERDRLRLQILRQLIDETLQIQEAKTADVTITPTEINQAFERTAQSSFKSTVAKLPDYLRSIGSSDRTLKREIEAELAWQRYLRRRVSPLVNVSDQEVESILARLKAQQGTQEFNIREIFLKADAGNEQQVFSNARALLAEIQKGQQPFEAYARQYTETSLKGNGGDLGWVRASVLPPELAQAAEGMQVGQVAGPIENSGGFSILFLTDKRQVLTADPRSARLSLKQLTVKFPAGISQADATARTAAFANGLKTIKGCGSVEVAAQGLGAEVVAAIAGSDGQASDRRGDAAVRQSGGGRALAGAVRARRYAGDRFAPRRPGAGPAGADARQPARAAETARPPARRGDRVSLRRAR